MLTEKNIKKYASTVLLNTVDYLFDNKETLINIFYKDFVESNKRNKKLKSNIKDNEVVDEYLLEELEKYGILKRTAQLCRRLNDEFDRYDDGNYADQTFF